MIRIIEIDENHFKVLEKMSDCGLGYYNEVILNSKSLEEELEEIKTEINELDTKFVASESDFIGGDIMINKDEVLNIINKYIKEI